MELIRTAAASMEEDFSLPAVEEEDAGIVPINDPRTVETTIEMFVHVTT
jgi:hypothetical protein